MANIKPRLRRAVADSLRTQLMLTTVVPVTALLVALVVVGALSYTRLTRTLVEQRDSELVQLAAQQVGNHWADSVLLLTQVASSDPVREGDIEAGQALIEANIALAQRFDRIAIADAQGLVLASTGDDIGSHIGEQEFFDRARRLRRPVRSAVYRDEQDRAIIAVAVPVYDAWGRFAGGVLGVWELHGQRLGLPVANVRVGDHGFSYLVDASGTILYHPSPEMVQANVAGHPAVSALLAGETGAQTVTSGGQTTVVGYAPIPLRRIASSLLADDSWDGWGLVTSELWDDIVAPLQPYVRLMGVLLVLVVTLPAVLLLVNSRRVVAPLQSLVAQVERVASGEFDTQVSVASGPTEVRELELAFNVMVDQLRRYRRDIRNYVVSILSSQEEERKRVARELHDETAQALIVLGRRIESAQELARDRELASELEALRDMVNDTLQGVRRFTSDLRPPLLEELGLARTLELLGYRIERDENLTVRLAVEGEPRQLSPELELSLYRLAQEGLSNVRRHARAQHVEMRLVYGRDAVTLEIADDGIGFDAPGSPDELIKSGGLGLMGIYERARLFEGKAAIRSSPGEGTVVHVSIPLGAAATAATALDSTDAGADSADMDGIGQNAYRS